MSAPVGCTGPGAYRAEIRRRFATDLAGASSSSCSPDAGVVPSTTGLCL